MIGYGYDANGNLTSEPVINYSYTYDAENHLAGFSGNGTSSFGYDGNGLRAKKVGTDGTITYSIFSEGHVIAEYLNSNGASAPGREFVYDAQGEYLATISGSGTLDFYHLDHQSIRLVTDATGNSAGERGDYPCGEIWYGSGFFTPNNFTSYRLRPKAIPTTLSSATIASALGSSCRPTPSLDPQTIHSLGRASRTFWMERNFTVIPFRF